MLASRTKRNVNEDTGKEGRKEKEEEGGREKKEGKKSFPNSRVTRSKRGACQSEGREEDKRRGKG